MTVTRQSPSGSGWAIEAAIQSKANAIPPLCRAAHGQILLRDNDTITVRLQNFYCNWVVGESGRSLRKRQIGHLSVAAAMFHEPQREKR